MAEKRYPLKLELWNKKTKKEIGNGIFLYFAKNLSILFHFVLLVIFIIAVSLAFQNKMFEEVYEIKKGIFEIISVEGGTIDVPLEFEATHDFNELDIDLKLTLDATENVDSLFINIIIGAALASPWFVMTISSLTLSKRKVILKQEIASRVRKRVIASDENTINNLTQAECLLLINHIDEANILTWKPNRLTVEPNDYPEYFVFGTIRKQLDNVDYDISLVWQNGEFVLDKKKVKTGFIARLLS